MPHNIGVVTEAKLATLYELQTVYGAEDLYDMLEIIQVNRINERLASKASEAA